MIEVPKTNLMAKKRKGEQKFKAILTKGKVTPQKKAKRRRVNSARREVLNMFLECLNLPPTDLTD
jgi:hypothetical protein